MSETAKQRRERLIMERNKILDEQIDQKVENDTQAIHDYNEKLKSDFNKKMQAMGNVLSFENSNPIQNSKNINLVNNNSKEEIKEHSKCEKKCSDLCTFEEKIEIVESGIKSHNDCKEKCSDECSFIKVEVKEFELINPSQKLEKSDKKGKKKRDMNIEREKGIRKTVCLPESETKEAIMIRNRIADLNSDFIPNESDIYRAGLISLKDKSNDEIGALVKGLSRAELYWS